MSERSSRRIFTKRTYVRKLLDSSGVMHTKISRTCIFQVLGKYIVNLCSLCEYNLPNNSLAWQHVQCGFLIDLLVVEYLTRINTLLEGYSILMGFMNVLHFPYISARITHNLPPIIYTQQYTIPIEYATIYQKVDRANAAFL